MDQTEDTQTPTRRLSGGATTEPARAREEPERGARARRVSSLRIGRFAILELLGEGGMGSVYAAYDERLDRRVAIKLLHDRVSDASQARSRMQREAQALAQLSHPNVVQIYDFGLHEEQMFVAMEYIKGSTLRSWSRAHEGEWERFVALMIQAGRGLEAAHGVGIVHRDFKPDNVLVGEDGRVRVADFGLARAAEGRSPTVEDPASVEEVSASGSLDAAVTHDGMLVGTPAYMAPEQLLHGDFNALTDQFSFCLVLFEGLYGERPYKGKGVSQLARAMFAGKLPPAPRGSPVPARIDALVRRGLSADPATRFPSMTALLAELDPSRPRTSRRWLSAVGTVGLLGVGVAVGNQLSQPGETACTGSASALDEIWSETTRAELREAMISAAPGYGGEVYARVESMLDDYVGRWAGLHKDACEAHARGEQTSRALDLQLGCLQREKNELSALISLLGQLEKSELERVVPAVAGIDALDRCADIELLTRGARPIPEEKRDAVAAAYARLDQVRGLERIGRFDAGVEQAAQIVADARELAVRQLLAEALLHQGRLHNALVEVRDGAVPALTEAYTHAEAVGDDSLRAEIVTAMLLATPHAGREREALEDWGRIGLALLERIEALDQPAHARLLTHLGESYMGYDGQDEEAARNLERAIEIFEASSGPEHIALMEPLNDLAMLRSRAQRYGDARQLYERALAVAEAALGPSHPHKGLTHNNLAMLHDKQGALDDAREHYERAIEILERALAKDHYLTSFPLANLAEVELRAGRVETARGLAIRALAIREAKTAGAPSKALLKPLRVLGELALRAGERAHAAEYIERALTVAEASYGPDSKKLAKPLLLQARLSRAEGRPEDAAAQLARARALVKDARLNAELALAQAELELARGHAAAARRRAEEARDLLKKAPRANGNDDPLRREILTWLTEHPNQRPDHTARAKPPPKHLEKN